MPASIDNGSTARIPLYCVLSSDHISAATGKTVAVTISKNGAAFGNPSAGATNATEIGNGWYYFAPSATDTGTNGPLIVRGTSATIDDATRDYLVATAPVSPPTAAAIWDEINTGGTHNITNSTGKQLRTLTAGGTAAIYSGTAPSQAGMTSTQIKLDAGASAVDNIYQYNIISVLSGTGAGDSGVILSYVGSTKVATIDSPWAVQPDATSVFEITPGAKALVIDKTGFALASTGADLAMPSIATAIQDAFCTAADTVQASPTPTTTSFAGSSALSSTTDFYKGSVLFFTSGALDGLARKITGYTGSTRLFAFTTGFPAAPAAGASFRIIGRID